MISTADSRQVRLRLTAAWALSEGLLGGLLHALKVPFTGLVVGSAAVVCLALLGRYRDRPGQLLRATLVVVAIKALLSPHAPLPAYLAVLFQGIVAEVLLRGRTAYPLKCAVLGGLALVESAVQKLLVLTLLFGNTIWQAADAFLNSLLEQFGVVPTAYAELLAEGYVGLHLATGLAIGWWAGRISGIGFPVLGFEPEAAGEEIGNEPVQRAASARKSRRRLVWGVSLGIGLLLLLIVNPVWLPRHEALRLLLRSTALLLLWYWLIGPIAGRWFRGWLARQRRHQLAADVDAVLALLPQTRRLLARAWRESAGRRGPGRWRRFVRLAAARLVS